VGREFLGRCFNGIRSSLIGALVAVTFNQEVNIRAVLQMRARGASWNAAMKTAPGFFLKNAIRSAAGGSLIGLGVNCVSGGW
jgi:hypothetical protein